VLRTPPVPYIAERRAELIIYRARNATRESMPARFGTAAGGFELSIGPEIAFRRLGVGAQCTHKVAHDGPNGGLAAIVWFVGKFVLLN